MKTKLILLALSMTLTATAFAGTRCDQDDITRRSTAVAYAMAASSERSSGSLTLKGVETRQSAGNTTLYEFDFRAGKIWVNVKAYSFGSADDLFCNVTSAQLGSL